MDWKKTPSRHRIFQDLVAGAGPSPYPCDLTPITNFAALNAKPQTGCWSDRSEKLNPAPETKSDLLDPELWKTALIPDDYL